MAKKPTEFSTSYPDRTAQQVEQAYNALSWRQRFVLRFQGSVRIGTQTHPGWTGSLPHYLVSCSNHGISETHPHGHEDRVDCHQCLLTAASIH